MDNTNKRSVEAEEFVLVDDKGQRLAVLGRSGSGGATLCFFDQSGARRCVIGVDGEGTPLITLGDGDEHSSLSLSQDKEETDLQVADQNGQVRVRVGVDGITNHAFVTLGSPGNNNQLVLFANEDGSTSVILHNSKRVPMLGLRVHPDGTPTLLVEQLGNILESLAHTPIPPASQDGFDAGVPEPLRPQRVEALDGAAPSLDGAAQPHHAKQPDAWDKSGIVL